MSLPIAKKSFGQNFLIDELAVKKIAIAAEIQKGETVLEIGPGTGLLTSALIRYGANVTAIELDHDFIDPLKEKFGDQINLIEGDVLRLHPLPVQDGAFKLVANIPYNITSPILEKFLAHGPHPTVMILMVQKEVADRIVAEPPQMSLLSVMCQLYAKCSRVLVVKAGSFRPIPKVDSAVVRFDLRYPSPHRGEGMGEVNHERVIALAKAGFVSRRKQLHHNLLPFARITHPEMDAQKIKTILLDAHLDPKVRAENLTIHDWINLEAMIR
jgi:16S rRNA (adenine1518-N6/adenine1519-N6)-dimethyltransferase